MKTRYWIIALSLVLILSAAGGIYLMNSNQNATFAHIISDGEMIKTVSLHMDQEFTVTGPNGGENTVTVRDGKIAVTAAPRLCVCPTGWSLSLRRSRRSTV